MATALGRIRHNEQLRSRTIVRCRENRGEQLAISTEARITFHGIEPVEGVLYEPLSRRAHVLDTGLEVFEIVRTWQEAKQDWKSLTDAYHWLTGDQLNAALEFYAKNPAMVDARLAREREARVEDAWERNPDSRPPRR